MSQAIKPKRSKYQPKRGQRILDPERAKAFKEERRAEDRERLANAIEALTLTDGWLRWLTVRAKFHSYSLSNTILIAMQCPDATRVAGYRAWQSVGRQVIRGAKAIRILAPMPIKRKDENGDDDTLMLFKSVSVFDVGQTTGAELPELPIEDVAGDSHQGFIAKLTGFAESIGYSVSFGPTGSANGWCKPTTKEIMVSDALAPNHALKTLVHEIAHALGIDYQSHGREAAEVIVESAAYVVCSALGLDTEGYSAAYVASWADGDADKIRVLAAEVDSVASKIEDALGLE